MLLCDGTHWHTGRVSFSGISGVVSTISSIHDFGFIAGLPNGCFGEVHTVYPYA